MPLTGIESKGENSSENEVMSGGINHYKMSLST